MSFSSRHLPLLLAVALGLGPRAAAGQPAAEAPAAEAPASLSDTLTGRAQAAYEGAKVLFADGDFENAQVEFERSYELSKDPRLLWNIAACEKNRRRYSKVLVLVDRYLSEGASVITQENRERAADLRETVQGFVGKLSITVNETGAAITVNDEKIGSSPLAGPLTVDIGDARVVVTKEGFSPFEQTLRIEGGGQKALDVVLRAVSNEGVLRVVASHGDSIRVDGKLVGAGQWQGSLPAGTHAIEVSAKGKRSHRSEIVVEAGAEKVAHVALEPESTSAPPPPGAKDEGGGSALWWVGGGVLLAAGLGVAAVLLFRGEQEPVDGTIAPGHITLSF